MGRFESFALGHHLSSWPDGMSFDEVIKILESDDWHDDMTVQEDYAYRANRDIAYAIKDMVTQLKRYFPECA